MAVRASTAAGCTAWARGHGLTDLEARRDAVGRLSPSDLRGGGISHTHVCLDDCLSRVPGKVLVFVRGCGGRPEWHRAQRWRNPTEVSGSRTELAGSCASSLHLYLSCSHH